MNDNLNNDDVLTVNEAVAFLKVSKRVLWSLANKGEIGRKVGGRWRFSRRQLLEWLERGEINNKGEDPNE